MSNRDHLDREILSLTLIFVIVGALIAGIVYTGSRLIVDDRLSFQPGAAQVETDPTAQPTPHQVDPTQPAQPTGIPVRVLGGKLLGLDNQCFNCAPFSQKIFISWYDPTQGGPNCFDWDPAREYCYSPTSSGIPYKAIWGFGAACPPEWPFGTWVDIPGVGVFICFDRGGSIGCNAITGVCVIDILTQRAPNGTGLIVDSTLWVPLNPPRGESK